MADTFSFFCVANLDSVKGLLDQLHLTSKTYGSKTEHVISGSDRVAVEKVDLT